MIELVLAIISTVISVISFFTGAMILKKSKCFVEIDIENKNDK